MPRINDPVACPVCGSELKYQLKQGDPSRLQAWCSCTGKYSARPVVETDLEFKNYESSFSEKPKKQEK